MSYKPRHKMSHAELVEDFVLFATQDTNESGRAAVKEIESLRAELATAKELKGLYWEMVGQKDEALLEIESLRESLAASALRVEKAIKRFDDILPILWGSCGEAYSKSSRSKAGDRVDKTMKELSTPDKNIISEFEAGMETKALEIVLESVIYLAKRQHPDVLIDALEKKLRDAKAKKPKSRGGD